MAVVERDKGSFFLRALALTAAGGVLFCGYFYLGYAQTHIDDQRFTEALKGAVASGRSEIPLREIYPAEWDYVSPNPTGVTRYEGAPKCTDGPSSISRKLFLTANAILGVAPQGHWGLDFRLQGKRVAYVEISAADFQNLVKGGDCFSRETAVIRVGARGRGGEARLLTVANESQLPLVFDLNGDGIAPTGEQKYWDSDGDGLREATTWISPQDAFLVQDKNGNGIVDDQIELVTVSSLTGFQPLAAFDTNEDGQLEEDDPSYATLRIWQDLNNDAVSQAGEVRGLTESGIRRIALRAMPILSGRDPGPVLYRNFAQIDGVEHALQSVFLPYDNANSVDTRRYTFNPQTLSLPELRGYGDVASLSVAMSRDPALMAEVKAIADANVQTLFSESFDFSGRVKSILFRWAGSNTALPGSRGPNFDAQKLVMIENMLGQPYMQMGRRDPTLAASVGLHDAFMSIYNGVSSRLLFQTAGHRLFTAAPRYNYAADKFSGVWQLDRNLLLQILQGKSVTVQLSIWAHVFKLLDQMGGIANITAQNRHMMSALMQEADPTGQITYPVMLREYRFVGAFP